VVVVPVTVGVLMFAAAARLPFLPGVREVLPSAVVGGVAALLTFRLRDRRDRFALGVAALLVGGLAGQRARATGVLARERSFYGAYTVRASATYHHLQHGNTLHGAQDTRPAYRTTPLTYYHAGGPLGTLFARAPRLAPGSAPRRVAVVGLGAGTVACWGRPGERWTFYEIDPLMVRFARDPRLFTYLRDCPPRSDVVLGDARLSLARAPRGAYDLILLDAFSSDAIPTHLLTREAVALYLDRLAPDGVLAVHVSNRYLRLAPVVARLAAGAGAVAVEGRDVSGASLRNPFLASSAWVIVARDHRALGALAAAPGWRDLAAPPDARPWTDDYTDVLAAVRWR
jgi:spermidine synthase